jgi:hypothetical protein
MSSAAVSPRAGTTPRGRIQPARSRLWVVPGGQVRPRRAPFVVLVLFVLAAGLVGLLVLNTSQGTFDLADLEQQNALLRDRHSELVGEVANRAEPGALASQAKQLGMVSSADLRFLHLDRAGTG